MGVTDSAPDVTLTESLRQSRMPVAGSGRIIRAEFISTHPWCHRMQTFLRAIFHARSSSSAFEQLEVKVCAAGAFATAISTRRS
jgi:hypothetical protein